MFYFWGVVLDLDKYIICWQGVFQLGHHLGVALRSDKYNTFTYRVWLCHSICDVVAGIDKGYIL
jgi:hypothetical protein